MKTKVLKYVALAFLAMSPSVIDAQINPKQGYVITNQKDTIYGMINYLSDIKCAYECQFKPDGEADYRVYRPGEISAYRFTDNGVFYITKTFEVEGEKKTFFAEYLLQGGVSLFHHKETGNDYYYFIGEDGKVACVKNEKLTPQSSYRDLSQKSRRNLRRDALGEITQIFDKSNKALHDIWVKDINARNLTQITYDYDMEYCREAGDCVQFRYNEKESRSIDVKLRLQAGMECGSCELLGVRDQNNNYIEYFNHTFHTSVLKLGIGADFLFPRSNNHWSPQVLALISRNSMTGEDGIIAKTRGLKFWDLEAQIGAAYSFFPKSKLSPVVRGGMVLDVPFSIERSNLEYLEINYHDVSTLVVPGFFLGAGVDIAIKKHVLHLTADYQKLHSSGNGINFSRLNIGAGLRL